MRNLVIIGNGFDLAHNLATKYSDFISDIKSNSQKYGFTSITKHQNRLLKHFWSYDKELWSDLEFTYYDILSKFKDEKLGPTYTHVKGYDNIEDFNQDFNQIKNYLCLYLEEQETKFNTTPNYESFFESFIGKDAVILNFNYTNTVKKYIKKQNFDIELIHIHGELENENNPVIFGFAADQNESKKLLIENNNSYVRNIKKFNYLFTNNEEQLIKHLNSEEYNVFILGHSCGISDKLILNQIFNSKNIHKIYPFYYKDRNGYFETMVNIDRIIDDYSKSDEEKIAFKKLASFPNSYKMPQTELDEEFIPFIKNILDKELPKLKKRKKTLEVF